MKSSIICLVLVLICLTLAVTEARIRGRSSYPRKGLEPKEINRRRYYRWGVPAWKSGNSVSFLGKHQVLLMMSSISFYIHLICCFRAVGTTVVVVPTNHIPTTVADKYVQNCTTNRVKYIFTSWHLTLRIVLPRRQKKNPVDFDDKIKIGDVRYKHLI